MATGTEQSFGSLIGSAFTAPVSSKSTSLERTISFLWLGIGYVCGSTIAFNRADEGKGPMLVDSFVRI